MEVDYSILTGALSFSQIITVLLGVAGVVAGFYIVRNHINTIILFLGDRGMLGMQNSSKYEELENDRWYRENPDD